MSVVAKEAWARVMASHSGIKLMLGPTNVDRFLLDPKRMAFFLSRYKFAAKIMSECVDIIDVGCGDGMGTLMFLSDTKAERVLGVDSEPACIDHAVDHLLTALRKARPEEVEKLTFSCRDFLGGSVYATGVCDGIVSLDVIEHVSPDNADEFIARLAGSLRENGVAVVGTPSIYTAQYSSIHSRVGHINLYNPRGLRKAMEKHFRRVFMFSMNDELVHVGFDRLAHYLIAVGVKL